MSYLTRPTHTQGHIRSSVLILVAFATIFFPRFLSSVGFPSIVNFVHFAVVPLAAGVVLLTAKSKDRQQRQAIAQLIFAIGMLLAVITASALLNQAGAINLFISFMMLAEPLIFLLMIISVPITIKALGRVRNWLLIFAFINLALAIAQSILLPLGLYPRPQGGTMQDHIVGVFGGGGGSGGNYISCTVSFYVALYFFNHFKSLPLWLRGLPFVAAIYQIQVSDSKQVLLALMVGWGLLALTKVKHPKKLILYSILAFGLMAFFHWAILNLEYEFLSAYRNWLTREGLFGLNGEATLTKTAAFRILPTHFTSIFNWFLGLGPGHSVSRLGGWFLRDYAGLLMPLGATTHPSSAEMMQLVHETWLTRESTVYFPMFTWAGIWGDLGFLGLGCYLYITYLVWTRFCADDFCRFLLVSTAAFGFIITQMEEPGHMLTIAFLVGLRWQELQQKSSSILFQITSLRKPRLNQPEIT